MRRIYNWFYTLLPVTRVTVDDNLFLLTETEIKAIKRRERIAIALSAIIGAMGVILLYLPYYVAPQWFPNYALTIAGKTISIPIAFLLYSVILVAIELVLLALLNIWCAHEIAVATGFLDYESKLHPEKQNLLLDIGMEKKNKSVLSFGIDPLLGVNRKVMMLWSLLFILKATITNILFRFFIQRVMGRYLIRAVQDFAGIPIFAFWNAYGTSVLLREARIIIMGQNLIEFFMHRMQQDPKPDQADKSLISDTLQFIAINKRDFHQNHYLLTRNVFSQMGIREREGNWDEQDYLQRLKTADSVIRTRCIQIILLGLVLDGKISSREKKHIAVMHQSGIIPFDAMAMQGFSRDFVEGRGVQAMLSIR